jgi:hypothetical protein
MKKLSLIILLSIVTGVTITLLFLASMTWNIQGACTSNYPNALPDLLQTDIKSKLSQVYCSGLAYGRPFRYVQSKAFVDISALQAKPDAKLLIGVSAEDEWRIPQFIVDLLIWTGLSFIAILLLPQLFHGYNKKTKK